MFSFLFKFIVLPVLLLAVLAAGAAAYLLLTPIDESSVNSRIWQGCMAGVAAQTANNVGRRTPRPVFSSAQCTCAADNLVTTLGAPVAAKGAESVRAFLEAGIRIWFSGGDYRDLQNSQTGRVGEAFMNHAARLSKVCANTAQ